jgi:hypothetical protein
MLYFHSTSEVPTQSDKQRRSSPEPHGDSEAALPRITRNAWSRPDLARMMDAESSYAPYITFDPHPRRKANCA